MSEYDVDTELLITLVQEHPVIWDRTHELYKHKNTTAETWRGICSILVEEYSSADGHEQTQICRSIQRKWTNLRDTWMKFMRKEYELKKSGNSGKSTRKYIYRDQMLFLQKNYSPMGVTDSSLTESKEFDSKHFMDDSNSQVFTLTFPQSPFDSECEMDVELLIALIEERPVIWDRTNDFYKHKRTTAEAWKEICTIIVDRYSSADEHEKTQICRTVQRKWTNLRDTWMKFIKKEAEVKTSKSGRKHMKKYVYHDQMIFLQKNFQMSDTDAKDFGSQNLTDDSNDQTQSKVNKAKQNKKRKHVQDEEFGESSHRNDEDFDMSSSTLRNAKELESNDYTDDSNEQVFISNHTQSPINISQIPVFNTTKQNKKRIINPSEELVLEELKEKPEENRHMYFFKGILPSIKDFDDDQTLEFQATILSVIRNIKGSRLNSNLLDNITATSFASMQTNPYGAANTQFSKARSINFGHDSNQNNFGQTHKTEGKPATASEYHPQPNAQAISSTSAPNRSPDYISCSPLSAKLEYDSQPNSPASPPITQL